MALSLTEIRQRLGVELRSFRSSTATTGSTVNTLVDTAYPYRTQLEDGAYTDFSRWWIFRPEAAAAGDQQRRVLMYHAPTGTFTPDSAFTNRPYGSAGEAYELWNVGLTLDEIHDCINQALRRMSTPDRFWLVPPENATPESFLRLALPSDAAEWCTNQKWINRIDSMTEPPLDTFDLTVQMASSVSYASIVAAFKRDRSKGQVRRIQSTTGTDSTHAGTIALALPQSNAVGNLLVLAITVVGGSITSAGAYTSLTSSLNGTTIRTYLYYTYPIAVTAGLTTITITHTGTNAAATLVEYEGLLPEGVDVYASATGTGTELPSGTTAQLAEGDELLVAVMGANAASPQFQPSNLFYRITNPYGNNGFGTVAQGYYERNLAISDLMTRSPQRVEGAREESLVEEQEEVFIYPLTRIAPPNSYIVEAQRPLYTFCRTDSTGQFGTKRDGLTAEDNEVEGDAQDGTLDAIVAGAITYAWERYPAFQAMADRERLAKVAAARQRFLAFNRSRQHKPHKTFRSREVVGML